MPGNQREIIDADLPGGRATTRSTPPDAFILPRPLEHRPSPYAFSLLEMMTVVALLLTLAAIVTPVYQRACVLAREAALRDHLFTLRSQIDRFTLDNKRPPTSLEDLVEKGYLGRIPADPFTGSNETWQVETEDFSITPEESIQGVVDVHSGSDQVSLAGTPYSSW